MIQTKKEYNAETIIFLETDAWCESQTKNYSNVLLMIKELKYLLKGDDFKKKISDV